MRLLTDSERDAQKTSLREYWVERDGLLPKEQRAFEAGFIAALDHSAVQTKWPGEAIAALQAELDRLKLQLKARDILLMKIGIDPAKIQVDDNG